MYLRVHIFDSVTYVSRCITANNSMACCSLAFAPGIQLQRPSGCHRDASCCLCNFMVLAVSALSAAKDDGDHLPCCSDSELQSGEWTGHLCKCATHSRCDFMCCLQQGRSASESEGKKPLHLFEEFHTMVGPGCYQLPRVPPVAQIQTHQNVM